MPAQLSLSAATITNEATGEVLQPAAQIVVRGSVATIVANRQRSELTGVTSIEAVTKGTWRMSTSTGSFLVKRVAGRCCGRARSQS